MARSRRKNSGTGWSTAASDKPFKIKEHRRQRAALRPLDLTVDEPPTAKLYGNPAHGLKDGKQWFDPIRHPNLMRK